MKVSVVFLLLENNLVERKHCALPKAINITFLAFIHWDTYEFLLERKRKIFQNIQIYLPIAPIHISETVQHKRHVRLTINKLFFFYWRTIK